MQTTSDNKRREFSVTLKEKFSATQTEILHGARVIFDPLGFFTGCCELIQNNKTGFAVFIQTISN